MTFPEKINQILTGYDLKKGPLRRLFGDQPAIRALRNLPNTDQNNPFKLYQCFNKKNRPTQHQASFQVYQAVQSDFLEYLDLTSVKPATDYSKKLEYLDLAFLSAKQVMLSPENNLLVGLLHWDTFNRQILMIEERHELIKAAVESLAEQANGKQYILVAPEYFYSRPLANAFETHIVGVNHERDFMNYLDKCYHQFYKENKRYFPGSIRQVEETQYREIVSFLESLSSQHPNLILFPGTIAHREAIKKEAYPSHTLRKRIGENIRYISDRVDPEEPGLAINDGNLGFYLNKSRTNEEKISFLKKFKYIAKNTALCFFQGQQVFSQDKVYNFGEIKEGYSKRLAEIKDWGKEPNPETIFLPGEYQGSVGRINGLSFAIDICADHPRSFLKNSLEQKKDEQLVNLHILQSAFLSGKLKSQCQAIDGYFIHASSELEYNTVIKREQEFFYTKETPYLKKEMSISNKEHKGKSTISFFKLPKPAPTHKESSVHYAERRMSI